MLEKNEIHKEDVVPTLPQIDEHNPKEDIEATYWFVNDYTIVLTPKQILFGNATVIKKELKDAGEL